MKYMVSKIFNQIIFRFENQKIIFFYINAQEMHTKLEDNIEVVLEKKDKGRTLTEAIH